MITYYELLEDNTIGRSTPFADVAASLGLTLTTDREIVYGFDGKRYFKGLEPEEPIRKSEVLDENADAGSLTPLDVKRLLRNKYLQDSDKYMLPDFPITTAQRNKWKEYRKYLRDFFNDERKALNTELKTFEEYFEN